MGFDAGAGNSVCNYLDMVIVLMRVCGGIMYADICKPADQIQCVNFQSLQKNLQVSPEEAAVTAFNKGIFAVDWIREMRIISMRIIFQQVRR